MGIPGHVGVCHSCRQAVRGRSAGKKKKRSARLSPVWRADQKTTNGGQIPTDHGRKDIQLQLYHNSSLSSLIYHHGRLLSRPALLFPTAGRPIGGRLGRDRARSILSTIPSGPDVAIFSSSLSHSPSPSSPVRCCCDRLQRLSLRNVLIRADLPPLL